MKMIWIGCSYFPEEGTDLDAGENITSIRICEDKDFENVLKMYEAYLVTQDYDHPEIHYIDYTGPVPCVILIEYGTEFCSEEILKGRAYFVSETETHSALRNYKRIPNTIYAGRAVYLPSELCLHTHHYLVEMDKVYGGISLQPTLPREAWHRNRIDSFVSGNSFKEALARGFELQRERYKDKV